MKNYWGAKQKASVQNMARYDSSLSKLQEGTKSNDITSHVDNRGQQKPLRTNNRKRRPTIVMPIADSYEHRLSSASFEIPSKSQSCSNCGSHSLEQKYDTPTAGRPITHKPTCYHNVPPGSLQASAIAAFA